MAHAQSLMIAQISRRTARPLRPAARPPDEGRVTRQEDGTCGCCIFSATGVTLHPVSKARESLQTYVSPGEAAHARAFAQQQGRTIANLLRYSLKELGALPEPTPRKKRSPALTTPPGSSSNSKDRMQGDQDDLAQG